MIVGYMSSTTKVKFDINKVYFPYESEDYGKLKFGFGYSPDDIDVNLVCEGLPLEEEWGKFTIEVRCGALPDYLITDLNLPTCSVKMKNVIEKNCNNSNDIDWLPVDVDKGRVLLHNTIFFMYLIISPMSSTWRSRIEMGM